MAVHQCPADGHLLTQRARHPPFPQQAANPATLRYCNLSQRGFVLHHVSHARWHAEFHFVSQVKKKKFKNYVGAGEWRQLCRGCMHASGQQAACFLLRLPSCVLPATRCYRAVPAARPQRLMWSRGGLERCTRRSATW